MLVAFAVMVRAEPASQMLLTKLLPGVPTVLDEMPKFGVEVPMVMTGKVLVFALLAGLAVVDVASVRVIAERPVPVYAVLLVPTPSHTAFSEVMKRSFPSVLMREVDVAFTPGALRLIATAACFESPNCDPAGDAAWVKRGRISNKATIATNRPPIKAPYRFFEVVILDNRILVKRRGLRLGTRRGHRERAGSNHIVPVHDRSRGGSDVAYVPASRIRGRVHDDNLRGRNDVVVRYGIRVPCSSPCPSDRGDIQERWVVELGGLCHNSIIWLIISNRKLASLDDMEHTECVHYLSPISIQETKQMVLYGLPEDFLHAFHKTDK